MIYTGIQPTYHGLLSFNFDVRIMRLNLHKPLKFQNTAWVKVDYELNYRFLRVTRGNVNYFLINGSD